MPYAFVRIVTAAILCILPMTSWADESRAPTPKATLVEQLKKYAGAQTGETDSLAVGKQLMQKLSELSNKELEDAYDGLGNDHWKSVGPDLCLTEMVHRGGPHWEKVIQAHLDKELAADSKAINPAPNRPDVIYNVVLLTALRRVQKKDDPLPILVEGTSEIRFHIGYPPAITANLTNLDSEKAVIGLSTGGDYRGASRHNRYRLEVVDAAGQMLPERKDYDMGGFMGSETLRSRESYSMGLQIGAYVQIDKPGTYTMIVQYHPTLSLAYQSNVNGLIYCQSIPIKLIVDPIEIETTDAEQARIAALILKLPEKGVVRILGGAYNADAAGNFLPKDSAAAQIHSAAWKSVPPLIAAVNGEQLNPTQRAWALGLLYGITGRNNPTNSPGVMGPYEYRFSGWVSTSNSGGRGSFSESEQSVKEGAIDPAAQITFAKTWKPWLENGSIRIKKSDEK